MKRKPWFRSVGAAMGLASAMALVACAGSGREQGGNNYTFTHDIGDTGPGGDVSWGQGFLFGLRDGEYKNVEARVRAIRAF
jgi:hypothetical protein